MACSKGKKPNPSAQDLHFLDQVRSLTHTAKLAMEEAEQFADDIKDAETRKQARDLIYNA